MTYNNTYDEKIMNWNRRDFSMLVEQMDECEIQEMNRWLLCQGIEIDSDCYTYEDYADEVVYEYIKRWLMQQLDEGITSGTAELLEIYRVIAFP